MLINIKNPSEFPNSNILNYKYYFGLLPALFMAYIQNFIYMILKLYGFENLKKNFIFQKSILCKNQKSFRE